MGGVAYAPPMRAAPPASCCPASRTHTSGSARHSPCADVEQYEGQRLRAVALACVPAVAISSGSRTPAWPVLAALPRTARLGARRGCVQRVQHAEEISSGRVCRRLLSVACARRMNITGSARDAHERA